MHSEIYNTIFKKENAMNANLEAIKQEIIAGAEGLSSSKEVYEFKKLFLDGKTGKIGLLMKEMKNIPNDQKAEYGKGVNELKAWATEFLNGLDEKMKAKELQARYEAEKIDISANEIDLFVPHQANLRILETAAKNLGVSMDKFFVSLDKFGNTSSASIPIALDIALEENKIKNGDKICLVGFGAGLTSASIIMEF
jgi:3-oxoacyl-[acyl-carrier-protein] synthase III